MGVAKTSRPGTGSPLLQHLLALECGGGLAPSPECPGPCNAPGAPRLQASTVPGYDGGAMLVSPLPSPTPCPSKLEAGAAALLQPGVQPPTGFKETSSCPKTTAPSTLDPSSNERIRTPQHFLPGCHGGPEGRITADCPPTPTHHYPILLQLSTTPTKYCATSRGRGQGRRGACDVIFGSPPAPPEPSSSASCCWRNDSILSRLDSTSFPSVPVPIEFPPSLRPSSHRPTRISRLVAKIPGWSLPRFTTAPLLPLARLISSLSGAWLAGMVAGAGRVRQKRWGWPAAGR